MRPKLKLQTHYYVTKGVGKFRRFKVVNRIISQSANLLYKFPLITIYIHGTPQEINTSNKRRTFAVPLRNTTICFAKPLLKSIVLDDIVYFEKAIEVF